MDSANTAYSVRHRAAVLWQKYGYALVVIFAVSVLYVPSLHHELIFDDHRALSALFSEHGTLGQLPWRRWLSHGTFTWIKELGFGFPMQRVFNVLVHLSVVWALYHLTLKLLAHADGAAPSATTMTATKWVMLFFAINPIAVYAVAYLIQRTILMATLFSVLMMLSFIQGLQRSQLSSRMGWWGLAAFCFCCALSSKDNAIVALLTLPILYFYFARPSGRKLAYQLLAALIIFAAFCTWSWHSYHDHIGNIYENTAAEYVEVLETLRPDIGQHLVPLNIVNQMTLYFAYGVLWVLPMETWMSIDIRPPFPIDLFSWPYWAGALGFVLWAMTALVLFIQRNRRASLIGCAMLMATLLFITELFILRLQDPFVLYRSYLWAIPLPVLAVMALRRLRPRLELLAALCMVITFASVAYVRLSTLQNDKTAWNDAESKIDEKAPANALGRWRPSLNLGVYSFLYENDFDKAMAYFNKAQQLGENRGLAAVNQGVALSSRGRLADALEKFNQSEAEKYTQATLYLNRGETLLTMGRYQEAIADYDQGLAHVANDETIRETLIQRKAVAASKLELEAKSNHGNGTSARITP